MYHFLFCIQIHMFDINVPGSIVFRESDCLSPGDSFTTFDLPHCKIGLGICYDIRFPELAQIYSKMGEFPLHGMILIWLTGFCFVSVISMRTELSITCIKLCKLCKQWAVRIIIFITDLKCILSNRNNGFNLCKKC